MKFNDLYTKILLTVIAVCLFALVVQTGVTIFSSPVEAAAAKKPYSNVDVFSVGTITCDDIKEVIILGDQHTFLLRTPDDLKVYRVDYVRD